MYSEMESKGRMRRMTEQERVKKCEGLLRTEGNDSMYANRIDLPMRAWFLSPIAETNVEPIANTDVTSTEPVVARSCSCEWCG